MNTQQRQVSITFAILCLLHVCSKEITGLESSWCIITKFLPIAVLCIASTQSSCSKQSSQPWQTLALGFSVLGDITLSCQHYYVTLGAFWFAIAHVCYFMVVQKNVENGYEILWPAAIPMVANYLWLMSETASTLLAIGYTDFILLNCYFALLTFMLLTTVSVAWHDRQPKHVTRALGFGLLYISDTLLGLMLYAPRRDTSFTAVMIVYYASQYLLFFATTYDMATGKAKQATTK